ncbi:hypothetical protein M405DRAFT_857463 [Rhizopogon salebrosus TDB-379]|nr:hypothetical protein M405DRAFT_857463 [Rhizopogon salebrosus TDB-379]
MSAPSDSNTDPLRDELDRLHQMLKENRARCTEARTRLEARVVTEKDDKAERDRDFMEIWGKLRSLADNDSRDNKTSDIRYKADASMEILLEASEQAHHESLAAIADFAEGKRVPNIGYNEKLNTRNYVV